MIWLIGENFGQTTNNNGFFFWKYAISQLDDNKKYRPYFVCKKTDMNIKTYNQLSYKEKEYLIWFDTKKHKELYKKSYFNIISLGIQDVVPSKIRKGIYKKNTKRIIHLTHGINFLKKSEMHPKIYNNNLTRLYLYNHDLLSEKIEELSRHQVKYNPYLAPRNNFLLKENEKQKESNEIVWFITWRNYSKYERVEFNNYINFIVNSNELSQVLKEKNLKLKIIKHHFLKLEIETNNDSIEILNQNEINFTDLIIRSKMLITDYSSVIFEYAFLKKPIIMFAPDRSIYNDSRGFYFDYNSELFGTKVNETLDDLIISIRNAGSTETTIHKMMNSKDYDSIRNNASSKFILDDLEKLIKNRHTFIVYNIFGAGGTIRSTLELSKQIIKNDELVDIISLRKTKPNTHNIPSLNIKSIVDVTKKSKKHRIKNKMYRIGRLRTILKYDSIFLKNKDFFGTIAEKKLINIIKSIDTGYLISTRESYHSLLNINSLISNDKKIYFFHSDSEILEGQKEIVKSIESNNHNMKKNIFVSKNTMDKVTKYINLKDKYLLYNSYQPKKMNFIYKYKKENKINILYISRIHKEKGSHHLIELIKKIDNEKFYFHIFGNGPYLEEMKKELNNLKNKNYFLYGPTDIVEEAYNISDFTVVLSKNESFGMVYIESILLNKPVLTFENDGSKEVLEGCENVFVDNIDDIVNKLESSSKREDILKSLPKNYKVIYNRFSSEENYLKYKEIIKK